jgi:hypothetical protein
MLSEEMHLIDEIISPLWTSLESSRQAWWSAVMDGSANSLVKEIGMIFSKRYELLAKFASVTTKRLQAIRKVVNNPKLSKRGVTRENVAALLLERSSRDSLIKDFTDEIAYICGKEYKRLFDVYLCSYNTDRNIKPEQYVAAKILSSYKVVLSKDPKTIEQKPSIEVAAAMLFNADKVIKDYGTCRNKIMIIKNFMNKVMESSTKEARGFCYQKILTSIEGVMPPNKWAFAQHEKNYELLQLVAEIGGVTMSQTYRGTFDLLDVLRGALVKYDVANKRTLPTDADASVREEIKRALTAWSSQVFFGKLNL